MSGVQALSLGCIAIGAGTISGQQAGEQQAVAIGYNAKATEQMSMSLGFDATASVEGGIAIGCGAIANVEKSINC